MKDDRQQKLDAFAFWADWTKLVMNFWQSTASTWQDMVALSKGGEQKRREDFREKTLEAWKKSWLGLLNPEGVQDLPGAAMFTELTMAGAKSLMDGCMQFQKLVQSIGNPQGGGHGNLFGMKGQEVFQAWMEFHENEIQPLLRMPQVGLTRQYQEKVNRLFDKFNLYHEALAEFQYLLSLPMERSLQEMREKTGMGNNPGPEAGYKDYYSAWIKSLESRYTELFRSPEWTRALSKLVVESAEFRITRNEVMSDLLQFLPIPTNKDMDEVYRELHELKRTVKQLVKKNRQQESMLQ